MFTTSLLYLPPFLHRRAFLSPFLISTLNFLFLCTTTCEELALYVLPKICLLIKLNFSFPQLFFYFPLSLLIYLLLLYLLILLLPFIPTSLLRLLP